MTNFNRRGFSLPELLAVMSIMAILAAASSPFIRRYIRDAGNDKAKTIMHMIAQAHKNFKAEYPMASLDKSSAVNGATPTCPIIDRKGASQDLGILVGCKYIHNVTWSAYKYDFYIGSCCDSAPGDSFACMKGKGAAPYDGSYCAWITKWGEVGEHPVPSTL